MTLTTLFWVWDKGWLLVFSFQHCRWIFTTKKGKADPFLSEMGWSGLETLPCLTWPFFSIEVNTASSGAGRGGPPEAAASLHFPASLQFTWAAGTDLIAALCPWFYDILHIFVVHFGVSEFPQYPQSDTCLNSKHLCRKKKIQARVMTVRVRKSYKKKVCIFQPNRKRDSSKSECVSPPTWGEIVKCNVRHKFYGSWYFRLDNHNE